MSKLAAQLLEALTVGSIEEPSVLLALVYCLSTHNSKMPGQVFTPGQALEQRCKKSPSQYSTNRCARK